MALKTRQELYDIMKQEIQVNNPALSDWEEGSILDGMTGASATAISEVMGLIVEEFNKTFIDTANGPEVTGSTDDLQTLAVDHFGSSFARPAAQKAVGIVTFSRPTTDDGDCTINAGTIVKTAIDANGNSQRFQTKSTVVMTGLSINASVEAIEAGTSGNVDAEKITAIETTLTDPSIVVSNDEAMSGGAEEQDDARYRQTIRDKLVLTRGAVKAAIEAAARTVSGVERATAVEIEIPVIEYDIQNQTPVTGSVFFRIPYVNLYVADANGTANDALINLVQIEINKVRAYGVKVEVIGATPVEINWTISVTFNPSGPNFSTLSSDPQAILDSMSEYLNGLAVGMDFIRADANAAILAIWGPEGTNDISAIATVAPVGNVSVGAGEKLVAGTMAIE